MAHYQNFEKVEVKGRGNIGIQNTFNFAPPKPEGVPRQNTDCFGNGDENDSSDITKQFFDFEVTNKHVLPIRSAIATDPNMKVAHWEMIMETMLANHICEDIKTEGGGLMNMINRTIRYWISTTEKKNRNYSNLISFFDDDHTRLKETLQKMSCELKKIV